MLSSLGLLLACGGTQDLRPNLVLITVDTLRADHLGSYGFPQDVSPRIDELAARGALFERAVAAASVTAPAHAAIMTSRYTREHSIGYRNGDSRLGSEPTLAELLRAAGYATAAFVGNTTLRSELGFARGFEVYDDELPEAERNRPTVFERTAEPTTRRALGWLAETSSPFFLWVHFQDPHGPYTAPERATPLRIEPPPGERPLPVLDDQSGLEGIPAYQALDGLQRPSEYRARYAEEIFHADRWIGELVSAVEQHDPDRELAILLTADHGESLGRFGRFFVHGYSSTPEVSHVPMILVGPGVAAARRTEVVSHVDIAPTLLSFANLEAPASARGVALGPILRGDERIPDRYVYCDIGRELSAYRGDRFLRVLYLPSVWGAGYRWEVQAPRPMQLEYQWGEGAQFSLLAADVAVPPELASYAKRAEPIRAAEPLSEVEIQRLRALGYVDD